MLTAPNWGFASQARSPSGKAHLSQDQYSGELFQNILFTRLKELHSHKTHTLLGDLKSLLHNTKANLTIITLFEIILHDDHDNLPQAPPPSSPSFLPPSSVYSTSRYLFPRFNLIYSELPSLLSSLSTTPLPPGQRITLLPTSTICAVCEA
jgi:hypothetical protein